MNPGRVWTQARKEWTLFRRDRLTVALAFVLPLATLLIFGLAIRLEAKNVAVAVQDLDRTPFSRAYVAGLGESITFAVVRPSADPLAALHAGRAKASVVIPPGTERLLRRGYDAPIGVYIDGTDVVNAELIRNGLEGLAAASVPGRRPPVSADVRVWFNPGRKESLFIVTGVIAIVLGVFPPLLSAIAMVRDKEEGTIVTAYASRLTAAEFIAGKALAYLGVATAEWCAVVAVAMLVWRLGFAGDPTPLLVTTPFYLLEAIMLGLFVGSRVSTQAAAVQGVGPVNAMLTILLSGFMYPVSNIPWPLSLISYVVPAHYYIEVTRDAYVRGTGWPGVWYAPLALAALILLFFAGAWQSMRRMQLSR